MSQHCDPRKVLRHISNKLLAAFFTKKGIPSDIKWDELRETEIEPIFQLLQDMEETRRRDIEIDLQDINAMATEEGVKVLVQDGVTWQKDLRDDLNKWDSRYDKAMWTYLHHHDVWSMALKFARADHLEGTRPWIKRTNVPKVQAKTDSESLAELQAALRAYFVDSQGRGYHCKAQHQLRNDCQDYFFISISDYASTYDKLDPKKNDFVRESEHRAFDVVIVYEKNAGALDVYAKGGKEVIKALQEIFARVILGEELPEEDSTIQPYKLGLLFDPKFEFPVDPSDKIDHVRLKRLRISVKSNRKRRITLEANLDGSPSDIHEMIRDYLNSTNLPTAILNVEQATIRIQLARDGTGRPPTFTFNLSAPDGSNLKSLREEYRNMGEKYLKKWGIEGA